MTNSSNAALSIVGDDHFENFDRFTPLILQASPVTKALCDINYAKDELQYHLEQQMRDDDKAASFIKPLDDGFEAMLERLANRDSKLESASPGECTAEISNRLARTKKVGDSMAAVLDAVKRLRDDLEACPELLGAKLDAVMEPLETGLDSTWEQIG